MDRELSLFVPSALTAVGNPRVYTTSLASSPCQLGCITNIHILRARECECASRAAPYMNPSPSAPFSPTAISSDGWKNIRSRPSTRALPPESPTKPSGRDARACRETADMNAERVKYLGTLAASPTNPPSPDNNPLTHLWLLVVTSPPSTPSLTHPPNQRGAGWWMDRYILPAPSILEARSPRATDI